MASDANDAKAQNAANVDAEHREASEYWEFLIKPDKCGTELFDRLLQGIADVISKTFEPTDSPDLTPTQMAAFYRAVGGNYDVLFVDTPPASISFIYKSLGAFHSLQPGPDEDGYDSPTIPALKKKGFVKWQTIQVLLGPEEHVPFLQNAVAKFDVVDPKTGALFPKVLPKECLPDRPDDEMVRWHEKVAATLKREAEEDATERVSSPRSPHVVYDDRDPRTSSEMPDNRWMEDRHGAAKYFSDPLYRRSRGYWTPPSSRHFSKPQPRYEEERNRGRLISSVRHMLRPFNRKSLPGRYRDDDSYSDKDETRMAAAPPSAPLPPRYPPHKRPHPPRRESTLSATDSNSESDGPPSRRRTPVLRNRMSHEAMPVSSREYLAESYNDRRYSHDVPLSRREDSPPYYGPTKSPLFATQVAHLQANNYYDRRREVSPRASRRPRSVRYTVPPPDADQSYPRERERGRDRDAYEPLGGGGRHRRRRSDEQPRERERSERMTRSHERVRDEWDEREDRSGERDRDRERRTHRYVAAAMQDGVRGRRYPVEQPWR